jgi:hypothetical protein
MAIDVPATRIPAVVRKYNGEKKLKLPPFGVNRIG